MKSEPPDPRQTGWESPGKAQHFSVSCTATCVPFLVEEPCLSLELLCRGGSGLPQDDDNEVGGGGG